MSTRALKFFNTISFCVLIFLSSGSAAQQPRIPADTTMLEGYYVAARPTGYGGYKGATLRGDMCSSSDWTSGLGGGNPEIAQMKITGRTILMFNGSVRCDVQSVSPSKTPTIVGGMNAASFPSISVSLQCFDEGTVGKHTEIWRLMDVSDEVVLLVTRTGVTPELWIKCRGQ